MTVADEQLARTHFHKTYQVLCEVLEHHPEVGGPKVKSFLDLGCAPGGFSQRLLEEGEATKGYGVSIPTEQGGFPVLIRHERMQVQACNLMDLKSISDLDCKEDVDVCLADAQDLGRRVRPEGKGKGKGKREREKEKEQQKKEAAAAGIGVQAECAVLGIWALTFQELMLGLGRLRAGGSLIFRFGWRGRGDGEEKWYTQATLRLLALVHSFFSTVVPFKSEFSHQADACFYVVAKGFLREAYQEKALDEKLQRAIAVIMECRRCQELPKCLEDLAELVTPEISQRIEEQLDLVGRLRQIGLGTRRHVQESQGKSNPEAGIFISPLPFNLTIQRVRETLERYGKINYLKRRAHPIGVGADAIVQFAQKAHADSALNAIVEMRVLGDNIAVARLSEMKGQV